MKNNLHEDIFLPASTDMVDSLVANYRQYRAKCEHIAKVMSTPDMLGAVEFFIDGNKGDDRYGTITVGKLFELTGAIAALNKRFWSEALNKTDLFEVMPAKRRDEWHEQLRNPLGKKDRNDNSKWEIHPLPDFEEEIVRSTMEELLQSRHRFFAERVDGIFKSLSGDHVTNQPQGFFKRMIFARVFCERWGTTNYNRRDVIHDLRCVIARLEQREEPTSATTESLLRHARCNHGQYILCDAGRIKLKAFIVGTCHIEIHPEVAVMLNVVLSNIYPKAIPPQFRKRNPAPSKTWAAMQRPLPSAVLSLLVSAEEAVQITKDGWRSNHTRIKNTVQLKTSSDKHVQRETEEILESIGGVKCAKGYFEFDYDAMPVLHEIIATGTIPDKKSHQFYPTPRVLAEKVIEIADIQGGNAVLEPSAGVGGLADLVPDRASLLCIELSELHCKVLREKGYNTMHRDFLDIPAQFALKYSRIIMNPPFDGGRWQAHLTHSSKFLADDGVLVAVLPASAKNKDVLSNMDCEWFGAFDNMFPDASVSVVILRAKPCKK